MIKQYQQQVEFYRYLLIGLMLLLYLVLTIESSDVFYRTTESVQVDSAVINQAHIHNAN